MNKTQQRFDNWAENYDKSVLSGFFNHIHNRIISELKPKTGDKILDIGCGTGSLLEKINGLAKAELIGIDFSKTMIKTAKAKKSSNFESNIGYLVADSSELPFNENYFDSVISTISFHHYPDQPKSLREINRVLKPSGRFYLADHSFNYPPGLVYLMNPIMNLFEGPIKINSKHKMKKILQEQEFSVLSAKNLALITTLYVSIKKTS